MAGSVPSTGRSTARPGVVGHMLCPIAAKPSRNRRRAPLTSTNAGPGCRDPHRPGGLDMAQTTVFSCSIARHAGDVDIEVIGAMDRSSAGQFRNQLLTLAKEHPASIAIDMDDLALVDS